MNQRNNSEKGTINYPNGSKYIGYVKDNKPHGEGVLFLLDGTKYTGQWNNGKMEGKIKIEWNSGKMSGIKYEGECQKGKPHGKGVLFLHDGTKYTGQWNSGKTEGIVEMEKTNG